MNSESFRLGGVLYPECDISHVLHIAVNARDKHNISLQENHAVKQVSTIFLPANCGYPSPLTPTENRDTADQMSLTPLSPP